MRARASPPNRVVICADEIGTIPRIDSFEMMLSVGRSRRISVVPIIQSFAQLEKNYGKEGCEIITDNCQLTIFGGFAPNSKTADVLSGALGNRTVLSGSVSRGKNDPSQSLQMIERPLLTADELKSLKRGQFVVMKTGIHPMLTKLHLFLEWSITFGKPYQKEPRKYTTVHYADVPELVGNIKAMFAPPKKEGEVAQEEGAQEEVEAPKKEATPKPQAYSSKAAGEKYDGNEGR